MRLNRQDDGSRQCISVTNDEVAAEEQSRLREQGLRPGDPEWEQWGIFEWITHPRIEAAVTGKTASGEPVRGEYKFTDEFSMAEGFRENVEFFTLTFESPLAVSHNRAFERIAPLLWMRAGAQGTRISALPDRGWEVAQTYGVLTDLDQAAVFCKSVEALATYASPILSPTTTVGFKRSRNDCPTLSTRCALMTCLSNFQFANGE